MNTNNTRQQWGKNHKTLIVFNSDIQRGIELYGI